MMSRFAGVLAVFATLGWGTAGAEPMLWTSASPGATLCEAGPVDHYPTGQDNDGDGVPDSDDWCLNSPEGAHVGSNGCAAWEIDVDCAKAPAAEPAARVVPMETPAPAPAPAPKKGAVDSDGDGIPDADDRCEGTPKGVQVDKKGCAIIEKVVLKGVNFATGSSKLLPAATGTLKTVSSAMKADGKLEVEVDGYTDNVGDETRNQGLSERRAKAVKDFLVKEGVDAGRLTTKGFGENNPVDTNDTKEGRANNRRVSFKVTKS